MRQAIGEQSMAHVIRGYGKVRFTLGRRSPRCERPSIYDHPSEYRKQDVCLSALSARQAKSYYTKAAVTIAGLFLLLYMIPYLLILYIGLFSGGTVSSAFHLIPPRSGRLEASPGSNAEQAPENRRFPPPPGPEGRHPVVKVYVDNLPVIYYNIIRH